MLATGGIFDMWLYSEREVRERPFERDYSPGVVARYRCPTCGAPPGVLCHRPTVAGAVLRKLPHFGRAAGGPVHNRTYRRRSEPLPA